ncbi:DUF2147 domain-containing protein [Novosphingobium sp. BL-52-GroH]|uniref:DUF2147 domain-containing protein n=1 Tax=Novosphingobium sp. BL-52-GroH TaxID=3349877 RepID=UPI00384E1172
MVMACILVVGLGIASTQAQASVLGRWLTDDGSGVVELAPCGPALCGRLVAVRDPKAPSHDVNNPDRALRGRMLVGIPILSGLVRDSGKDGAGWSGGQAYDPKAGRTYRASIRLGTADRLDVTGCLFLFCRTRHWTRATTEQAR